MFSHNFHGLSFLISTFSSLCVLFSSDYSVFHCNLYISVEKSFQTTYLKYAAHFFGKSCWNGWIQFFPTVFPYFCYISNISCHGNKIYFSHISAKQIIYKFHRLSNLAIWQTSTCLYRNLNILLLYFHFLLWSHVCFAYFTFDTHSLTFCRHLNMATLNEATTFTCINTGLLYSLKYSHWCHHHHVSV